MQQLVVQLLKNFLLPKMKKAKEIEFVDFHASDFENYLVNKKKP